MTPVTQLSICELPLNDAQFSNNPDPYMIAAQRQHAWLAKSDFGYVITEYQAISDIMSMDAVLTTPAQHIVAIMGGEGTEWGRFQIDNINARGSTDHRRIRTSVSGAFTPKAVSGYHERIRIVIKKLLDEWAPKGEFDFAEFASNFPVAVMFGLVGASPDLIPKIKDTLEVVGQSFSLDRSIFPRLSKAFDDLWSFVDQLVVERSERGDQSNDLLDALINARSAGQMNDTELRDLLIFLFVAGYDTSKNQLTHIVNLLLDRPEAWQRCPNQRDYCDRVVEEVLRHSGVATSYRDVKESFEYRDVSFPQGTMLIFPLGIACRYSEVFLQPDVFDPERGASKRILAFGRGAHICLGQYLARLQIAEGLHMIASRLINPERSAPVAWRPFPGVWGLSSLPLRFEASTQ
jgi:cytochrome P450